MTQLSSLPVTVKKISDPTSQVVIGNGIRVTKTTNGVQVMLPAVDHDRIVGAFWGACTESFSNGTGAWPTWKVGDSDDDDRWTSSFSASAPSADDDMFCGMGTSTPFSAGQGSILAAGKSLIVTSVAAVGDATGGFVLSAITINLPT